MKFVGFTTSAAQITFILQSSTQAFTTPSIIPSSFVGSKIGISKVTRFSTETDNDAAFSAFAETLEEDELFNDADDSVGNNKKDLYETSTWQESLEAFLDPMTPPGKKQVLLSDLVSANEEIRTDLEAALRERKVGCVNILICHAL